LNNKLRTLSEIKATNTEMAQFVDRIFIGIFYFLFTLSGAIGIIYFIGSIVIYFFIFYLCLVAQFVLFILLDLLLFFFFIIIFHQYLLGY
jgi:hypothetical protein